MDLCDFHLRQKTYKFDFLTLKGRTNETFKCGYRNTVKHTRPVYGQHASVELHFFMLDGKFAFLALKFLSNPGDCLK